MTNKYIIFDFDGTIADTIDLVLNIFNKIAEEYKLKPLQKNEVDRLKAMRPQDMIKEFDLSKRKLTKLVLRVRQEMQHSSSKLSMIKGMKDALDLIKNAGYQLGILTSNSKENVEVLLANHKISEFFEFIYSGKKLFGKKRLIKKMMKNEKIAKDNIIYVGDETRDVEACKAVQIPIIAVSWGFNSRELLMSTSPNFIANHPKELLEYIGGYFANKEI